MASRLNGAIVAGTSRSTYSETNQNNYIVAGLQALALNVKDYGAIGDGVTDDTSPIQAAITAGQSSHNAVLFPPGSYLISQISTTGSGAVKLFGIGPGKSILVAKAGSSGPIVNLHPSVAVHIEFAFLEIDLATNSVSAEAVFVNNVLSATVHDLWITGGTIGVHVTAGSASYFDHLRLIDQTSAGVLIQADNGVEQYWQDIDISRQSAGTLAAGVQVDRLNGTDIGGLYFHSVRVTRGGGTITNGFYFNNAVPSGNPFFMTQCVADNINGGDALKLVNQKFGHIVGSWFTCTTGTTNSSISIDGGQDIKIVGCWLDPTSGGYGVTFANTTYHVSVVGCRINQGIAFNIPALNQPEALNLSGNNTQGATLTNQVTYLRNVMNGTYVTSGTPSVSVGTAAKGTGTIASGATTAVITHGLSTTPVAGNIHIIGTNNPTNDPGHMWLSSIGATTFTVNCRADPGSGGATFSWQAAII